MNELLRVTPESVGLSSRDMLLMLQALERCGTEPHGLMVSRHGKVALECWWAPYTRDTVHICHSFGKSYVATAVGAACTDGLLTVEDRIVDLFRDEINEYHITINDHLAKLRVKHLLSMSNGMSVHAPSGENVVRNYLTTIVDREPGSTFMYNTTGSCMLGEIVRRVTGKNLYEYMKGRVFDKIGLDTDRFAWMAFRNGLHAAPGVASNTENNLRLGLLYLQNGYWNNERVIDSQWIADATKKQIDNGADGYGYQLWLHPVPGVFRFCGGHGQDCVMSRPLDLAYSIQQAASEPHDTDAVNTITTQYLLGRNLPETLPEDPEALAALNAYIAGRRLPNNASASAHAFSQGWDGVYQVVNGSFHIYPELRPFGDNNVYRDFYEVANENVGQVSIRVLPDWVEITLDGKTELRARLDGQLIPHQTYCALPSYPWECSGATFEQDTLIVDTWFFQTCFKTRMWFVRKGDILQLRVRKERLHDDVPYFWYNVELKR
jgi:CubicO group peptidase (beta-lactamase class C family)